MTGKTKVVHSKSKDAWNVIGTCPGGRYKFARVPYVGPRSYKDISESCEILITREKAEALELAIFISDAINKSGCNF